MIVAGVVAWLVSVAATFLMLGRTRTTDSRNHPERTSAMRRDRS